MFSPLKDSHEFNKYVKVLRVKMTKRVRKTNKSPEDQQESGRLPRARTRNMKTTKGKNKKHEDCQVLRIQKSKSLED